MYKILLNLIFPKSFVSNFNYFSLFIFLCLLGNNANAQSYTHHYIAPAPWVYYTEGNELIVTTNSTTPVNLTITKSDGTIPSLTPLNAAPLVAGSPKVYRFVGAIKANERHTLNTIIKDAGLYVFGDQPITVNLRNVVSDQGDNLDDYIKGNASLFSFGDAAVGNSFRVGYYRDGIIFESADKPTTPIYSVMAINNGTIVKINGLPRVTLNAGESYLFQDKMGSLVETSGPAVMNTNAAYDSPFGGDCFDSSSNPVPPISSLGTEYILVRGNGNDVAERTTVIATEDNTVVTVTNFTSNGAINGTSTYVLAAAGDFVTFDNGVPGGLHSENLPEGQIYSASRIQSTKKVVAYSGTADNCEIDVATLAPISDCTGSTKIQAFKFRKYSPADDLPYFAYIIVRDANAKVFITTDNGLTERDIETLPGVGVRRQLGSTGSFIIDFTNSHISNPSSFTLSCSARLTVSMVQQGGGFSMSNFLTPLPEKALVPTFALGDCASAVLSADPASQAPYQWYLNGILIPGATSINYTAVTSGVYTVTTRLDCGNSAQSLPITINLCNVDRSITKVADNNTPTIGATVNFTLTAKNLGPGNAINVLANDLLPAGFKYVSHTASIGTSYNSANGQWIIGSLAANGASIATLDIRTIVQPEGPYLNTATITGAQGDDITTNNEASVTPSVIPEFFLNSPPETDDQVVCFNQPITPIVYHIGGSTSGASANLPAGLTGVYTTGNPALFTITGTPTNITSGKLSYDITTVGGPVETTITGFVTVNGVVETPIFNAYQATRCQGAATVLYAATATNAASLTYALTDVNNQPMPGAGTINVNTGEVIWNAGFIGLARITATAAGCTGNKTAFIEVTVVSGGTVTADFNTVCSNASGTLTANVSAGTILRWESSTNAGLTWQAIANTSSALAYANLASTTVYRVVSQIGSCAEVFSATATINVSQTPVVANSAANVCAGDTFLIEPSGVAGGTTYSWSAPIVNSGSVTGGVAASDAPNISGTLTGNGTVTYTVTPKSGLCTGNPFTVTVTVYPAVNATLSYGDNPFCKTNGGLASPTITGTGISNGIFSSAIGLALNAASGVIDIAQSQAGNYTITYTYSNGNCTSSTTTAVTINPLASGTITGGTTTCVNATTAPLITFTGVGGTAPYTFTYKINGGTTQTITTTAANSISIPVSTATAGTYEYALVSVKDASTTSCINLTASSVTVNINPLPIATNNAINLDCNGTLNYNLQQNISNGINSTFSWTVTSSGNVVGAAAGSGTAINQTLYNTSNTAQTVTYTVLPKAANTAECGGNPFTVTVNVPVCSSISINKTTSVTSINAAETVVPYTISVVNNGNANQTNVELTDMMLGGVMLSPVKTGGNNDNILEKGETWTYTGSYTVSQSDLNNNGNTTVNSGKIINNATVVTDQIPAGQTATNELDIVITPAINLVKTGLLSTDGNTITYTFTIKNTGNVTLNNLLVTDVKVTGITVNSNTLAPGATTTGTAIYTIAQAEKELGVVSNTAIVTANTTLGASITDVSGTTASNNNPTITFVGVYPLNDVGTVNAVTGGVALNNVLVNDKLNGNPATLSNINLTQISTSSPNVTLDPATGRVTVAPNTPAGIYTLVYQIADKLNPANTKQATVTVTVTNGAISAAADAGTILGFFGGTIEMNILANDTYNAGQPATLNNVAITQLSTQNPKINIDPATGKVVVQPRTLPGVYILTYQITDKLDPTKTATANVVITIPNWITDLRVTKTANKNVVETGEVIRYTITVFNLGTATVLAGRSIVLTENLPTGLDSITYVATGGTYNPTANTFTTTADVDAGQSVTLVVTGKINPDFAANSITNSVNVNAAELANDPNLNNNSASVTTPVLKAKIALTKTGTINTDGDAIIYNFLIKNTGNVVLSNIWLYDSKLGLNVNITGTLAPGATRVYSKLYTLTQSDIDFGRVTNTATVRSTSPAGNTITDISGTNENNNTPTVVGVAQSGSLSFTKVVNGQIPTVVGEALNYNLVVRNTGNVTLSNIVVTDNNAKVTGSPIASLLPGAIANLTAIHLLTQADIDNNVVSNQASVTAKTPLGVTITKLSDDPNTPDVDDATIAKIPPRLAMELTKTANNTGAAVGDVINYTLIVKNTGNVTLNEVNVTDAGADVGSILPANVAELLPNATTIFTAKHTLTQADVDLGSYSNQAAAAAKDRRGFVVTDLKSDDPNTAEPDDPTVVVLTPTTDLVTVKSLKNANQLTYVPGDDVVYTIVIKNNGPSAASNVRVSDLAPKGTTITSWTAAATGLSLSNTNGTGDLEQTIPQFPVNAQVVYEVTVKTPNGSVPSQYVAQPLVNTVNVTSSTIDLSTNGDVNSTNPLPAEIRNDLSITKTSDHLNQTGVDAPFDYTITVKNNGYFTSNTTEITDVLPANLTYVSHTAAIGSANYTIANRTLLWSVQSLQPSATATLILKVKANKPGLISNTVNVSAKEADPLLDNNTATDLKEIYIVDVKPNVITPNGDGKNDTWVVDGLELYPENSLSIFNRWGNEVFHSNGNYKNDWGGNGLKEGTYYYLLKVKDTNGVWSVTKGYITLLRNN